MDMDETILDAIKDKWKTASEIAEETGLPRVRVSVRLRQLRKPTWDKVICMHCKNGKQGVNPMKYKAK